MAEDAVSYCSCVSANDSAMATTMPSSASEVEQLIKSRKHERISSHFVLNNHASTRPRSHGGPLCESVTKCKTFERMPGSASVWRCILRLPNSFHPTDGLEVLTEGVDADQSRASEQACVKAFAILLCLDPSQVLLRPKHWMISIDELVAEVNGILHRDREDQALPVQTMSATTSTRMDMHHVLYGGSRMLRQRYEYSQNSKSAFVDLITFFRPTPAEFKSLFENVPGVAEVESDVCWLVCL